ncbi:MAG: hypothetical protein QXU97_05720 [Fervidicoccaceae archaeon]
MNIAFETWKGRALATLSSIRSELQNPGPELLEDIKRLEWWIPRLRLEDLPVFDEIVRELSRRYASEKLLSLLPTEEERSKIRDESIERMLFRVGD